MKHRRANGAHVALQMSVSLPAAIFLGKNLERYRAKLENLRRALQNTKGKKARQRLDLIPEIWSMTSLEFRCTIRGQ